MRFRNVLLLIASFAGMILGLAGCSSSAPPPPPISVSFQFTPPSSLQTGNSNALFASVSNDPQNAGVDWSVTCGSAGACGSFSPTHTTSGSQTIYTAPGAVPGGNAVTVIATSSTDKTKSVSANITITPAPIAIFFSSGPPSNMETNATAAVAAFVSNDSANAGVDWSVTCGSAGACGSFSSTHTASGSSTAYTAPSAVPPGNTVTIIATSTADNTKSASATVGISSPADLARLSGNYVFELSGEDNTGSPYSLAGQLTADGAGNITGGEQDFSDFFSSLIDGFTGAYSVGPDGRGTITVNPGDEFLPGGGVETFAIVVVSASHVLMIETDSGTTSSGTMDSQTVPPGGFSASTLSGGCAFALFGIDVTNGFPLDWGGVMNIDSPGGISGAGSVSDINDGSGVFESPTTLNGSILSVDSLGRADILLTAGSFAGVEVIAYIADPAHLKLVEIDGVLGVTGGTAIGQGPSTGTFTSNAALSGNFVFDALGIAAFNTSAAAGLFTADGAGNIGSGVLDLNSGGVTTNPNFTGTYSVDSAGTGRGTVTLTTSTGSPGDAGTFAFYLTGGGSPAMLVELDSNSQTTGAAFPQASGPFSASSFSGPFGMNFTENALVNEEDATGQVSADGIGSFTGLTDANEVFLVPPSPTNIPLSGTFTANSNGRFTGTMNGGGLFGGTISVAFYVVDNTQILFIETDSAGVTLGVFELQTVPLP